MRRFITEVVGAAAAGAFSVAIVLGVATLAECQGWVWWPIAMLFSGGMALGYLLGCLVTRRRIMAGWFEKEAQRVEGEIRRGGRRIKP